MNNFTILPKELLNKKLSQGAFRLYVVLISYCYGNKDMCYPSQSTLAAKMDKCTRTIRRYLRELEEHNLITVKRRGSTSSLYKVTYKTEEKFTNKYREIIKEIRTSSESKKGGFTDYPQRQYNYELLEKALLNKDVDLEYPELIVI